MAFDPFRGPLLFCDLRVGREGVQFERFFRAVSYLLNAWCSYTKREPSFDHTDKDGILQLRAIAFDKLGMVFHKLWSEMFRQTEETAHQVVSNATDAEPSIVTFPSPVQEITGVHGRGTGRFDGTGPPIYLLEILHELQMENTLHYFTITPPKDKPDCPTDHRTTVRSEIVGSPKAFLQSGFTEHEVSILSELGSALKHLSAPQIRALGTHENATKTVADIEKEFRDIEPFRAELMKALAGGGDIYEPSSKVLFRAEEARRKSMDNRKDYSDARDRMLAEIENPAIKDAFCHVHSAPELIWDGNEVRDLAKKAERVLSLSRYIYAIAYYQRHRERIIGTESYESKRFAQLWAEAYAGVTKQSFPRFPSTIENVFDGDTDSLVPELKNNLIYALKSIGPK